VALIAREHELRRRRGSPPSPDELLRRFPQYRDALLARLAPAAPQPAAGGVGSVESLSLLLRQGPLLEPGQAAELNAIQAGFREPRDLARELLKRNWLTAFQVNQLFQGNAEQLTLGPYLLLERLGQGGMGTVFKARHQLMKRDVALKLIRKDCLADEEAVRRFHREVRAAGQLSHPNIVIAHDASCVGDRHFLVMELVEGTDMQRLVQKRGPQPVAAACDYIRQAALGLQHAHEKGMVHRDVKPHNLMVTPQGLVKVLDLGLARLMGPAAGDQTAADLTEAGVVMGTPDYMAPEQAEQSSAVDIRADVYSLGCTLYVLLAGQVPFPGGTAFQKILRHQQARPTPIQELRLDVPAGLAAVLEKMTARRPEDRYPVPGAVAVVLEVFCGARPPVAIPLGPAPASECVRAPVAQLVPPGAGGETAPLALPADAPTERVALAETSELGTSPAGPRPPATSRRRLWKLGAALGGLIVLAVVAVLALCGGRRAPEGLDAKRAEDVPAHNRPEGAPNVVAVLGEHRVSFVVRSAALALSPVGDRFAVSDRAGVIFLGDARTLRQLGVLKVIAPVNGLAFSHDGKRLAAAVDDGTVWVWDVEARKRLVLPKGHTKRVSSVAFSPKGPLLLSASEDGTVGVWDVEKRVLLDQFKGHTTPVMCVAFSPDGSQAVSGGWGEHRKEKGGGPDDCLLLWTIGLPEGRPKLVHRFKNSAQNFTRVVFSPDGKEVVTADRLLRWWAPDKGTQIQVGHAPAVNDLTVSRDGSHLLTSHNTPQGYFLWRWDNARREASEKLRVSDWVSGALFPDGARALYYRQPTPRIWNAEKKDVEEPPLVGHIRPARGVGFTPDGKHLLSWGDDATLRLWDVVERRDLGRFQEGLVGHNDSVAFSPSGKWALDGGAKLWDVRQGKARQLALPAGAPITWIGFREEEGKVLTFAGGVVREWGLEKGGPRGKWQPGNGLSPASLSPDGKQLLCSSHVGELFLVSRGGQGEGTPLRILTKGRLSAVFSPDGKRIYFTDEEGVKTIDLTVPKPRARTYRQHHSKPPRLLAVSPDGNRLFTVDHTGVAVVWDTATKEPVLQWQQPGGINGAAFASDSRHLATANGNTTIYILRLK
jgi:WD40 repeat protein/tRNA A-37 threonylcarbamoyl transferase component Bud32